MVRIRLPFDSALLFDIYQLPIIVSRGGGNPSLLIYFMLTFCDI
jgi:hypothetical protein